MASVIWISLFLQALCSLAAIVTLNMYLPTTAKFDGALSASGFHDIIEIAILLVDLVDVHHLIYPLD